MQAKSFLEALHGNKTASLALILENEPWTQADVPVEFQLIIAHITSPTTLTENAPTELSKEILLDGHKFVVVNSCLLLFKMVSEYLKCLELLPSLNTDIIQKIVEILQVK